VNVYVYLYLYVYVYPYVYVGRKLWRKEIGVKSMSGGEEGGGEGT
jgi:hypothetical protein